MFRIARRVLSVGLVGVTLIGLGVTPAAAAPVGVLGSLDTFVEMRDGAYSITGWRFADDGGPVSIHVYDTGPTRTIGTDLGIYRYYRPDVEAVYGRSGTGFEGSLNTVEKGPHRICVFAVAVRLTGSTPLLLGCRDFVAGRAPVGSFDVLPATTIQGDAVTVQGWAYDPDQPQTPLPIHAYVEGIGSILATTPVARPDVAAVFPSVGATSGFTASVGAGFVDSGAPQDAGGIGTGRREVCVFAVGVGAGGNTLLGCRATEVLPKVRANLDSVTTPDLGRVAVGGWSYLAGDPSAATVNILSVGPDFFDNAATSNVFMADRPRPDVDRVFPGVGTNHGYVAVTSGVVPPGPFLACVISQRPTSPVGDDPWDQERCSRYEMPHALGAVDSVVIGQAAPGTATVRGWAIDPIHPSASIGIEAGLLPVRGSVLQFTDAAAQSTSLQRPDVNAAFGVTGAHGFEVVVPIPAGFTGQARACVQVGVYSAQPACFAPFATRTVTVG